jgi:hypothetical protein
MTLFSELYDYISPLYSEDSKKIFSRLPLDKYYKILNMYTNQQYSIISDYIIFRLENESANVEVVYDYTTNEDKDTYQVIYYDVVDKTYLFQGYSFKNIYELIITNSNRYVFIPIMLSIKDKKIGHATILIIDSNGLTKGNINHNIINKFMKTYFEIFNITFNENYNYIEQEKWINIIEYNKYILNKSSLKTDEISSGHCMIFTLLIAHLLSNEKYDLQTIIFEFNKLKKNDLLDIIMGYPLTGHWC